MESTEPTAPNHETPTFGNPDLPQEGEVNTLDHPAEHHDDRVRRTR